MESIGRTLWVIAEGFIPADDDAKDRRFISHEIACILNPNKETASIEITIYFADKDPVGPYSITLPRERSMHLRFNDLEDTAAILRDTDFSSIIRSSVPVVVQHTRLDSRISELALQSTVAFAP
ncbi:MAG: sensory rhodopsin transducer [Thioalkalivibrio sp.]|nr:sensory rhodopsin transducer [Thioalkalivibrio sp.]